MCTRVKCSQRPIEKQTSFDKQLDSLTDLLSEMETRGLFNPKVHSRETRGCWWNKECAEMAIQRRQIEKQSVGLCSVGVGVIVGTAHYIL